MTAGVEPSIAELARAWESSLPAGDWAEFITCSICGAPAGSPCVAMYRAIVDGQVEGPPTELAHPHGFRKRRKRR